MVSLFVTNKTQGDALREFLIENKNTFCKRQFFDKWSIENE